MLNPVDKLCKVKDAILRQMAKWQQARFKLLR